MPAWRSKQCLSLCHAAEQRATASEVVEIEHENWASTPKPMIHGCCLSQADPWGSSVLPCGKAYVSCQTNEGPQSWAEHLGQHRWLCSPSTSHWTVPAWWSLGLVSIILAGIFGDAKPNTTFLCPFPLLKERSASRSIPQNWTFGLKNNFSLWPTVFLQDFFLHPDLRRVTFEHHFYTLLTWIS